MPVGILVSVGPIALLPVQVLLSLIVPVSMGYWSVQTFSGLPVQDVLLFPLSSLGDSTIVPSPTPGVTSREVRFKMSFFIGSSLLQLRKDKIQER